MKETIYNFRIKTVGEYHIPEFNHDVHGWSKLNADVNIVDNELIISMISISVLPLEFVYKPKTKEIAMAIINKYKDRNNLEFIKYEYEYITNH